MNPLELTQAAADSSGRTLADISPVYGELQSIAESVTSEVDPDAKTPDAIEAIRQKVEQNILLVNEIEVTERRARDCLKKAEVITSTAGSNQAKIELLAKLAMGDFSTTTTAGSQLLALSENGDNEREKCSARNSIVPVLLRQGDIERATELADQTTDLHWQCTMLTNIYATAPDPQLLERILAIARGFEDDPFKADALFQIALKGHHYELIPEAIEAAKEIPDTESRAWLLVDAVEKLAQAGELTEAYAITAQLTNPGPVARANAYIARANHDPKAIQQVEAICRAHAVGELLKSVPLSILGQMYAETGDLQKAEGTLGRIATSLTDRGDIVISMVKYLLQTDPGIAQSRMEELCDQHNREYVHTRVAVLVAETGDVWRGISLIGTTSYMKKDQVTAFVDIAGILYYRANKLREQLQTQEQSA